MADPMSYGEWLNANGLQPNLENHQKYHNYVVTFRAGQAQMRHPDAPILRDVLPKMLRTGTMST